MNVVDILKNSLSFNLRSKQITSRCAQDLRRQDNVSVAIIVLCLIVHIERNSARRSGESKMRYASCLRVAAICARLAETAESARLELVSVKCNRSALANPGIVAVKAHPLFFCESG